MSQFEYGIGGTERPEEGSEGMAELPMNKTLMISKLTSDDAVKPVIVKGLTNVEAVFEYYKPTIKAEFSDESGAEVKEEMSFKNLGDFGAKGLTKQSRFLQDLNLRQNEMNRIVKQLRSNKIMVSAMQNPEAKAAFVQVLKEMTQELELSAKK